MRTLHQYLLLDKAEKAGLCSTFQLEFRERYFGIPWSSSKSLLILAEVGLGAGCCSAEHISTRVRRATL